MHGFLKSIGFRNLKKKKEVDVLINEIIKNPDRRVISEDADGSVYAELSKDFGELMGISVRGEYNEDDVFEADYYYPYFQGSSISTYEHVEVEKHSAKESYAGICDEVKVGVTLIYYLQNIMEYKNHKRLSQNQTVNVPTVLSALAGQGKILFPIKKDKSRTGFGKRPMSERNSLIAAARDGDEEAIESLTLEDIDTYSMISKRIQYEDVLTIVNSYFMPYGIESDQYNILGEILDYHVTKNHITEEEIVILNVDCNNLVFDVCINRKDLLGEPAIGRRFKGNIWMQGFLQYEN